MLLSDNTILMVSGSFHNTATAISADLINDLRAFCRSTDRALKAAARLNEQANATWVDQLHILLDDAEPFVREAAARPLARIQGAPALQALLSAMRRCEREGNPSRPISIAAGQLVIQNSAILSETLAEMMAAPQCDIRTDAAWCYGFMPADDAISPLLCALRDPNTAVRIAAANALRAFENPAVVTALCQTLFDSNEQVRVAVAATLSQIATSDSISIAALQRAQRDSSQAVRVFAEYALRRLKAGSPSTAQATHTAKPRHRGRRLLGLFARA